MFRVRKRRRRHLNFRGKMTVAGFVFIILFVLCEIRVAPLAGQAALSSIRAESVTKMEKAVSESMAGGVNFETVYTDSDGNISGASLESAQLNQWKADLTQTLQKQLSGVVTARVDVGTLTGARLLSGRGPQIPVKTRVRAIVSLQVVSALQDSGINQTLHTVTLHADVTLCAYSMWLKENTEFSAEYVLCETLIVGKVPQWTARSG